MNYWQYELKLVSSLSIQEVRFVGGRGAYDDIITTLLIIVIVVINKYKITINKLVDNVGKDRPYS